MYKSYITNTGAEKMANLKNETIQLSRIAVSDKTVSEAQIYKQTALANEKSNLAIVSTNTIGNVFNATSRIESLNIDKGFYVKQVGLFLKINNEEILFQISQVIDDFEGNYIPSVNESSDYFAEFSVSIALINDNSISCNIDITRYAKIEDLETAVEMLENNIDTKVEMLENNIDTKVETSIYNTQVDELLCIIEQKANSSDVIELEQTKADISHTHNISDINIENVTEESVVVNNGTNVVWEKRAVKNVAGKTLYTTYNDTVGTVARNGAVTIGDIRERRYGEPALQGVAGGRIAGNVVTGAYSVAMGSCNNVTGLENIAGGFGNTTSGSYAVALGSENIANGDYAIALGSENIANGDYAIAIGNGNVANEGQYVIGKFATDDTLRGNKSIFKVGIGISDTQRLNVFRATSDGYCYGLNAFGASGADFAEYFEWIDGNKDNEDRRGLFVTLEGEKIRLANKDDDYILGVVSAMPTVIGDVQSEMWQGKYLKDVFGDKLKDENGNMIISSDFDDSKEYIGRDKRNEWTAVGLVGKLICVDDGSCEVNRYCTVGENGMGTKSKEKTQFRVMSRIDEKHIKVLVK